VVHSGPIELGHVLLPTGDQPLNLLIVGKNPKSTGFLVGLDWVKLVPVK